MTPVKLMHIKLKNGEDLLGQFEQENDDTLTVVLPISIHVDPNYGLFVKSWCLLSTDKSVSLSKSDAYFFSEASAKGYDYYERFIDEYVSDNNDVSEDTNNDELEDIIRSLYESKISTIH